MRWLCAVGFGVTALVQAQSPRFMGLPELSEELEAFHVFITAPEPMNARERGAWQLLSLNLLEGTTTFTREDIFTFGTQAGFAPSLQAGQDVITLQWIARRGSEGTTARLIESILTSPQWDDERLGALRARLSMPFQDDWSAALAGPRGDTVFPVEFMRRFQARAVRPESLNIAATPGALRALGGRFADWKPPRIAPDVRVSQMSRFRGPERANVLVLSGKPLLPVTSRADDLLAVVALGGGKTALLHRVARDERQWSYRQEAFFVPARQGWFPTVALAGVEKSPDPTELKTALIAESEKLNEADFKRIQSLAKAALAGRNPLSPFRFQAFAPFCNTTIERSAWASWIAFWGVGEETPEALERELQRVSLSELKSAIKDLVQSLTIQDSAQAK